MPEYLDQGGLFEQTPPDVDRMARFIDSNLRSAKRMGEAFTAMASFLETEGAARKSGSLFGEEAPLTADLAMQAANQRMQANYGGGGQSALFSQPPQYAPREPGETDKAYAKRAIDPGPAPESLPYAPDRMFARYPGAVLLPLDALVLTKSVTAGEQGRNVSPKRMLAAYHGALPPRPPVSVRALPNGKYEVTDGNGTVAALRDLGWPAVPALVENAREKKRALIAGQSGWTEADIYQHALPNQAALASAGAAIAEALGVEFANPGIKEVKRLREKVELENYAGPDQVADVVRGGFLTDSAAQSEAIVEQLAKRFEIHDKGIVVTDTGFVDRKVLVKFENGQVGEVQIVPRALDPLARGPGAQLYKQQRALYVNKEVPPASVDLFEQLTRAQIDLYAPAVASMPGWAPVALAGASPEVSQVLKSRTNSASVSRSPFVSAAAGSTGRQGAPGDEMTNATSAPDSASPVTSGRSSSAPSSRTDLTGSPSTAASVARVRGWLEPALKALEPIVRVNVVATTAELPDPNAPPDVEGAYTQDGEVWFVAENLPTQARALEVGRHEVFGHMAIERNGKFKARLDAIVRAIKAGNLKDLVREVRGRQGLLPASVEAREVVALMAERGVKSPLLGSFRTALREVGRDLGLDMPVDEAELTALVGVAAGDLRRDAALMRDFRAAQGLPAVQALSKADPTDYEILAALDAIYGTEDSIDYDWRRAPSGKRVRPGSLFSLPPGSFEVDRSSDGDEIIIRGVDEDGDDVGRIELKLDRNTLRISSADVFPSRQGEGIGQQLIEQAYIEARDGKFKLVSDYIVSAAQLRAYEGLRRKGWTITYSKPDAVRESLDRGYGSVEGPRPIVTKIAPPKDWQQPAAAGDADADDETEAMYSRRRGGTDDQPGLFGDDRKTEQEIADEQRQRDERRNPNRDVAADTGDPNDLFTTRKQGYLFSRSGDSRTIELNRKRYPIEDSAGKLVAAAADEQRNFWRWFGDSKVVDAEGKPLVVYHGTAFDFSAFDLARRGNVTGGRDAREGFFFAGNPDSADQFTWKAGDKVGHIMPVYLRMENPAYSDLVLTGGNGAAAAMQIRDAKAAGHDGLIFRDSDMLGHRGPTYVAFEPAQIKSAIGNSGAFDPANPSILYSRPLLDDVVLEVDVPNDIQALLERVMAPRESDLGLMDRARAAWRKLTGFNADAIRQGVIDSFDAVKQLEKGQVGKLLDAADSPYKAALATRNLPSVMAATMLRGVPEYRDGAFQLVDGRQGVIEIFRPLTEHKDGNLLPLWELYAAGKRAKELKKQGRENLFSDADIQKALSLGQQYPEFEVAAKEWETFNGQLLELAAERGVLDPAAVKAWKANFYVPFYRAMEEAAAGGEGPKTKKGIEGHGGAAVKKRLKGGEEKLGDVFENMLMNTAYLLDEAFKNTAMQKIAQMGDGVAMEKIPLKWDAVQLPAGQLEKALDAMGATVLSRRDIRPGHETNAQTVRGPEWRPGLSNDEREEWLKLFRRVAPVGKDVVAVYEGGKPVYYRVTDDLLLRSIANMGYDNFADVFGLFRGSKRLLTGAITLDPAFMMANWVRDTLAAWVTSDAGIIPVIDSLKGAKAAFSMDSEVLAMMAAGGGGGGVYDMQPTELRTFLVDKLGSESAANRFMGTIVSPKNWLKAWRKIGNAAENANRVAIYRAVRAKGGSVAEAAYQARDVLNFTMSGDFAAMRWLTATVPFMNARIQGLYRLWRGAQDNPTAFAMKGLALTAATLALLLRNNDEEEYEQLPEWDKDTYWHFFVGGEHYRLPKPFEVGAIFGTIPERMYRLGSGRDSARIAKERVMAMLGETFAFNPIPQLAKPMIEQYANKSFFTGSPIVGMAEANLAPEAQYTPWTSDSLRMMAAALPDWAPGWMRSPQRLEAMMRGYLGATGTYALQAADTLARGASGAPARPARKLYDVPVVKRFMQDPNPRVTKYADQLYSMLEESNAIFRTINRYREQGRSEDALELIEENRGKLAARGRLNRVATRVRSINNQIQLVMYSQALTPEAKRERIDGLTAAKNQATAAVAPLAELF